MKYKQGVVRMVVERETKGDTVSSGVGRTGLPVHLHASTRARVWRRGIDTSISRPIAEKFDALSVVVANLQPADVGRIFANSQDPLAFLPFWGLHVTEFCLGYCNNLPHKRMDAAPLGNKMSSTAPPTQQPAHAVAEPSPKRRRTNPLAARPPPRVSKDGGEEETEFVAPLPNVNVCVDPHLHDADAQPRRADAHLHHMDAQPRRRLKSACALASVQNDGLARFPVPNHTSNTAQNTVSNNVAIGSTVGINAIVSSVGSGNSSKTGGKRGRSFMSVHAVTSSPQRKRPCV